jgi:hypothetical protein
VGEDEIEKRLIRNATRPQNLELNSSDSRNKKHDSRNILGIKITTAILRSLMYYFRRTMLVTGATQRHGYGTVITTIVGDI